jgi:hypothetical protein
MIRIASFNVENLFARPKVFELSDWNAGEPVLKAYEKVSALIQKAKYSATGKIRIRDLLVALDIYAVDKKNKSNSPQSEILALQVTIREQRPACEGA